MWLPDFLLPETATGFGPVSKVVSGGVGALLIIMAGMALLPAHSGSNTTTLAQVSSDWQQKVTDQAAQLSDACAKAGQVSVPDDVASDADVTAAGQSLNDVVTESCAFGTLHQMQQAVFGEASKAWNAEDVTALLDAGTAATTKLTGATNALSDAITKAQDAITQAQLAAALATFTTQSAAVSQAVTNSQAMLKDGKPLDPTTATNLQAELDSCNAALAADQTSIDAVTAATTTLQGCATDLPRLTQALVVSQQAYKQKVKATQTTAPAPVQTQAPQPPPPPPVTTQPPSPPALGKAQIAADGGGSVTVQVYVTDPDHVGYSVCIYNGTQLGAQVVNTGTRMLAAAVPVSPSTPRDPRAVFC